MPLSISRCTSFFWTVIIAVIAMVQAAGDVVANDEAPGTSQVVMRTTMGDMTIELDHENAPQTVENFLSYVDRGFYTDTLFHRVIDGFVIQGGGFSSDFLKQPTGTPVSNEAYNGLENTRYSIAMARTTAPHSATSQFFINTNNNERLNHQDTTPRGWGYTVFGSVIKGRQVVDAINNVATGAGGPFSKNVPVESVVILGVDRVVCDAQDETNVDAPVSTVTAIARPRGGNPTNRIIQDLQSGAQPAGQGPNTGNPELESAPSGVIANQN